MCALEMHALLGYWPSPGSCLGSNYVATCDRVKSVERLMCGRLGVLFPGQVKRMTYKIYTRCFLAWRSALIGLVGQGTAIIPDWLHDHYRVWVLFQEWGTPPPSSLGTISIN